MRLQVSAEFLIIAIVFLTIFSYVTLPLVEESVVHVKDVSTLSNARLLLDSLASASRQVEISRGRTTITLYSPCEVLSCTTSELTCRVLFERDPDNVLDKNTVWVERSYSVEIRPGTVVNGRECIGTGVVISSSRGQLRFTVEKA